MAGCGDRAKAAAYRARRRAARLVGRAVEDDRPLPEVHGGMAAPAAARNRVRGAGRSASPRRCRNGSAQRELPDQARATAPRLAAADVDRPHVDGEPAAATGHAVDPPPQPLLTTSSSRPRGQPTLASPLSRPPSSGVQLRPPARQARNARQPRLALHASTTRVAFVQPRANTSISSPCVSTDSQRPFGFTWRLSGAVNVNVAAEQSIARAAEEARGPAHRAAVGREAPLDDLEARPPAERAVRPHRRAARRRLAVGRRSSRRSRTARPRTTAS